MLTHLLKAATTTTHTPKAAWVLGGLNVSLLPWFAAAVWFAEDTALWVRLSIAYEALTLGVLGGVRMGIAFGAKEHLPEPVDYTIAILLPLIGWLALIPVPLAGGAVLMAGFLVSTFSDYAAAQAGRLPYWYGRLRLQFLPAMVLFLAVVMAKLMADEGWFAAGGV